METLVAWVSLVLIGEGVASAIYSLRLCLRESGVGETERLALVLAAGS